MVTIRKNSNKKSTSDMFIEYAQDYIRIGSNLEETKNYLNFACIAWNLSLFPKDEMKEKLKKVVNGYEELNSFMNAKDLKHDLEMLIDKKVKAYTKIKRLITKISIREDEGYYLITAESEDFKESLL